MLSDNVRVLDFDDSVTRQTEFISTAKAEIVAMDHLGRVARLWANDRQTDEIRQRLVPDKKDAITFIGSGDYHFVSALLLEHFAEPISLIVFDHHPDWDVLPPRRGCGAWINRALENENVAKVVLVGNASSDLTFPGILTGNLRGARVGRILSLPYETPRTRLWRWTGSERRELKRDPRAVFAEALRQLPTRSVYLSIDKDCLTSSYALTNWEEGRLELDLLLDCLNEVMQHCDIVGVDVTGDYSEELAAGRWKKLCSKLDHPREFTARGKSQAEIDLVNGRTNERIVNMLRKFKSSVYRSGAL